MRAVLRDVLGLFFLMAAAAGLFCLVFLTTGCMTTTVKFGTDGKVAEIQHSNLLRVGTAIIDAPESGGASVSTTAQGMSPELAGVMKAGVDKAPSPIP